MPISPSNMDEEHRPEDEYKLYVERCLKKNIRPFGPKEWFRREKKRKQEITAERIKKINIAFIVMMRTNGVERNLTMFERARHNVELGNPTKTWDNDNPIPCPLCKDLLCPWAK